MDKITISVIFIFLPGILALMISEKLTSHPKREGYELLAFTFVLGCLSHVLYLVIWSVLEWLDVVIVIMPEDKWLDLVTLSSQAVGQPYVVAVTAILGVLLGFAVSYAINFSLLQRVAKSINASNKIGDVDLWTYLFNSTLLDVGCSWVVVRDVDKNLMYQGMVLNFSDTEEHRELILQNVSVFDNKTGEDMYTADVIYISFEKKNVSIEIYNILGAGDVET